MNKLLTAVTIEGATWKTPVSLISKMMDKLSRQPLQLNPWTKPDPVPEVQFAIGHHNDCIFIKYYVKEKHIRAAHTLPNSPVYTDTCVEFFIEPESGEGYYNLEFNCIGTCLAGFGKERRERVRIPEGIIKRIKFRTRINNDNNEGLILWELTLMIPIEIFCFHRIGTLQGLHSKANFYKCGDELPQPHYLSWIPVTVEAPDFHLPEYFGQLNFE